jgi:hypothetical protein
MRKEVEEILRNQAQQTKEQVAKHFNLTEAHKSYYSGDDIFYASRMGFTSQETDESGNQRFYKIEMRPMELTDEECAALLNVWRQEEKGHSPAAEPENQPDAAEWSTEVTPVSNKRSKMAGALMTVAIVEWISGLVLAFVFGGIFRYDFNFQVFWTILLSSLVVGLLFAALSRLLQYVYSIACMMNGGAKAVTVQVKK